MMLLALALVVLSPAEPGAGSTSAPGALGMGIPTTQTEAMIVNSGSTNTAGYRLWVNENGWTTSRQGDVAFEKRVPLPLVKRLFADLRAAAPLDEMEAARCMKSASFGSTLRVAYRGKLSPDLSCPGAGHALQLDAAAVIDAAGVPLTARPRDGDRDLMRLR